MSLLQSLRLLMLLAAQVQIQLCQHCLSLR
jgi:hypothetical protein